jgi:hypothetical protein
MSLTTKLRNSTQNKWKSAALFLILSVACITLAFFQTNDRLILVPLRLHEATTVNYSENGTNTQLNQYGELYSPSQNIPFYALYYAFNLLFIVPAAIFFWKFLSILTQVRLFKLGAMVVSVVAVYIVFGLLSFLLYAWKTSPYVDKYSYPKNVEPQVNPVN